MELCSLTAAGRENVIQTYLGLAQQVEGSRLLESPHFSSVISVKPFSFCNFVIGLAATFSEQDRVLDEVVRWARIQPALRIFAMTGDQPGDWSELLLQSGLSPQHRLVQLAWTPNGEVAPDTWTKCESAPCREAVSRFMVQQFFSLNEANFKRAVVHATATGPHELWRIDRGTKTVAAAMIVRSRGAIGLYNLCVSPDFRRRGYGESVIRSCQNLAVSTGLPLILQCEQNLIRWYSKFGFQVFGEMQSFQCRFQ